MKFNKSNTPFSAAFLLKSDQKDFSPATMKILKDVGVIPGNIIAEAEKELAESDRKQKVEAAKKLLGNVKTYMEAECSALRALRAQAKIQAVKVKHFDKLILSVKSGEIDSNTFKSECAKIGIHL